MSHRSLPTRSLTLTLVFALALVLHSTQPAHAFTSAEHVVVVRVGDGIASLSSAAAPVTLLEIRPSDGATVAAIALPTSDAGANQTFTLGGTTTSEGMLSRSPSGQYLVLAGYDAALGTANVDGTTSSAVQRVVARVHASGTVDTSTTLDAYSTTNIRAAFTTDGTNIWTAGGTGTRGGLRHLAFGSSATTGTQITASPTNARGVSIFGGQLFISSASTTFHGVSSVGSGQPVTSGQSTTLRIGSSSSGPQPYEFALIDVNQDGTLDRAYVADDRVGGSGGIQRWEFNGAAWTLAYTLSVGAGSGARGLAAHVARPSGEVTLYVTTTETSNNRLVRIIDTGVGAIFTTVASAGANFVFRGAAMAPGTTPTPVTLGAFTAEMDTAGITTLRWTTMTEYEAAGYHILRSASGRRDDATRATPELIPASGDGLTGATYRWDDSASGANTCYWLEAINRDGTAHLYGPVQASSTSETAGSRLFLPLVGR